MSEELKTLNDMDGFCEACAERKDYLVNKKEIKQEAIKRAKSHLQDAERFYELSNKESFWYWKGRADEALIFSDQTEKDLKEEKTK